MASWATTRPQPQLAACGDVRAPLRRDHSGVARDVISDDGWVITRELDHDVLEHNATATDATRAPRPAQAEVLVGRGPWYVPLSGGASFADVNGVAS